MSVYAIQKYHKELEKIIHFGGSKKETAIRNAFYFLLNEYAHSKELMLIAEISTKNKQGKIITPDGTLKDNIRNDWGYWESKDESDDIDEEIRKKFVKGYPSDNILFEDSATAVLYQHGDEVMRRNMRNEDELHEILTRFLSYERPEVHDFREAIEHFKQDIPKVTIAIREIIEQQQNTNTSLKQAQAGFLEMAKASINPDISADDVKEMMLQHILSADIFNTIFDEPHFHQENNIARELNKVIDTFFTGQIRRQTLGQIKHYYDTINARAASIADHHEKQKFLKVVYEAFYKGYNPKAADRLGIVYTPNEIVQFMIRSTDYLLHKHFGKTLGDKNVEILDPATGTGTYITDIIDYLPKGKLKHKYKNELHANEVAILPYYIANLNIEYTYKQKMGEYAEFENLCFMDTLDRSSQYFVQGGLFGVSAENTTRIKRQNERKISVIIGNPPYNAKQENYNYQNANRAYKEIDKRIKETYIKHGTAQNQIVVYDMYTRFYRWAMDRLDANGIIAFITNRSFIDGRAFDGFRKLVASEFNFIYIVDLGGDVRVNPKLSGTKHNVFGIQTGVAIMFLVKKNNRFVAETKEKFKDFAQNYLVEEEPLSTVSEPVIEYNSKLYYSTENTRIHYFRRPEMDTKADKLTWLSETDFDDLYYKFDLLHPDKNHNWINHSENNWDDLMPLVDKEVKAGKSDKAIFKIFSRGVATQRDEWVYDYSEDELKNKMQFFIDVYEKTRADKTFNDKQKIKWDRELTKYLERNIPKTFDEEKIVTALYRPFVKQEFYFDKHFNGMTYQWFEIFKNSGKGRYIAINSLGNSKDFFCIGSNTICDLHLTGDSQCLPLHTYNDSGEKSYNISDWALKEFQFYYKIRSINQEDIFHYVYAVLHNPAYRKKYEQNLKREFPRIPFYPDFHKWKVWGEDLMNLHVYFENTKPFPLTVESVAYVASSPEADENFKKAKLKANKDIGEIILNGFTTISGIPKQAWNYKLGNRSALEWVLDQYKEKKPSDPTIAEKFNTYRFEDYKEQVIDLLMRVCTVSMETMKVVGEMSLLK